MKQPNESRLPSSSNHAGLKLAALALMLAAIAIAADLTWMVPHATLAPDASREHAAQSGSQDESPPAAYFPSQFKLQAKDDEAQAPTF